MQTGCAPYNEHVHAHSTLLGRFSEETAVCVCEFMRLWLSWSITGVQKDAVLQYRGSSPAQVTSTCPFSTHTQPVEAPWLHAWGLLTACKQFACFWEGMHTQAHELPTYFHVLRQLGERSAGHLCYHDGFDSTCTIFHSTCLRIILHYASYCTHNSHDAFQVCLVRLRWWATVDADALVSTTCQAKLVGLVPDLAVLSLIHLEKYWITTCWNVRRVSMWQHCQLVHSCLFAYVWKLQILAQGASNLTLIKTMTLGSIFCIARIFGLK